MKPLRLEMKAFGPFRGPETVDFEKLDSSLFIIAGPIGAGKTTILDAICFALYGESSGKGRAAGDLRSHHADATVETEVTFDFSVGGKTYRVNRLPKQEIRKKRGAGTRAVQARGALWDRTGKERTPDEGTPLAGNVREVDERIREILGFDAAQFRQVILLPQGQFREFLSANSKDREAILKVLFDVRRCEELERELRDEVEELERNRQGREAARREKLGTFTSREDLEQGVRGRAGEVAALEVLHRELATRDARVETALAEGRRAAGLFAELAQTERVRADLAEQADAMDAVRDELALAEKARPVLPEIAALDTLRGEIAVMERDLGVKESERIGLTAASLENEKKLQEHKAGESRHEGNIAEISRLEDLRPKVRELENALREKAAAAALRVKLQAAVAAAAQSVEDEEQRLGRLERELPVLRASAGERATLEAQVRELRNVEHGLAASVKFGGELEAWTAQLSRARAASAAAAADLLQVEKNALEMRARWLRSHAGALAAQLVEGQPCPVCGSPEHPAPTAPTADGVTEEGLQTVEDDRQAAADREKRAGENVSAAAVKVAEFTARVDGLRQSLGAHADADVAEIHRTIVEQTAAHAAAVTAVGQVTRLEAELVAVRERKQGAADSLAEISERRQQAAESAVRSAAVVEHLEGILPGDLRSGKAIEQRLRLLADEMASWRRTLQLLVDEKALIATSLASCTSFSGAVRKELEGKSRRGEQAALDLGRRLAAAGFADEAACRTVSRTDRQLAALRERLEAFNNTLQQAQGALVEARRKVLGLTRPDLAPLEQARAAATGELQACGRELGRLQEQHRALSGRLRELDELEKDEEQAALRSEALREIAAAAAGDNSAKMRFSTYALAAYFDEVMAHTNRRLALMSSGRYTLARATDTGGRGYKGLDLEVLDAHTDRARPADTLSGGEGFLAALALALGLADAVQSAAGGYKLESVFIDEGFGSLDAESLDLAQRCIIDLQQTGRMVGLISHVEEMSSWTPARIVIRKTPRGSTIL